MTDRPAGDLPFCTGGVIDDAHKATCPAPHGDPTAQPVYLVQAPPAPAGVSTTATIWITLLIVGGLVFLWIFVIGPFFY